MITSFKLINFKNFANEQLRVGPFTVIVGANASGKSNIRDAFRILHGIGRGYTLSEIIGGKYGTGGQQEWAPVRGGADEIIRFGQNSFTLLVGMNRVRLTAREGKRRTPARGAGYLLEIRQDEMRPGIFRVTREKLKVGSMMIYTSRPGEDDPVHAQDDDAHLLLRMEKTGDQRKFGHHLIEGQTAKKNIRVVTTTHSPDLLSMVGDDTFENTSVVCRRQDTDDAVIRRIAELPRAAELRQSQGLGPLHVSGWMEDAITFTEESSGDEEEVE